MERLLTFRLAGTTQSTEAGFAYRLITRDDTRLSPADPASDAYTLIPQQKTSDGRTVRSGAGTLEQQPSKRLMPSSAEYLGTGKQYTLAMACRGRGTFRIQIREDSRVVADHTITCGAPPRAYEFPIDHKFDNGKETEYLTQYRSESPALASIGYAMIEN